MNKRNIVLSGMQPTNNLHVGNYLGALKQYIDIQNTTDNECFFFIADLHALTVPFEPKALRHNILNIAATYIAAGVDPKKSTIFIQSTVPQHAELAWIFNCITPLGELERMTQYKDKSKQHAASISTGLLDYPVLMAADILMYKPQFVPVGEDQMQHLELARIIARKFNNAFGKTFPEPKNFALTPLRIMSLKDPEKKMSKSGAVDNAIWIDDSPEEITHKLKKAVTGTDGKKSPGVENLLLLLRHFGTKAQMQYFEDAVQNDTIKYSELKETLATNISDHFAAFRQKKHDLLKDKDKLADILATGARNAQAVASETLSEVKQKIGLL